jgi:hypothetical protein
VLDAELNSLSNGSKFKGGHRAKIRGLAPNTDFLAASAQYSLLTFAPRLVLRF